MGVAIYVLSIKDTKIGVTEEGINEFDVRAYLIQYGFDVLTVTAKASGHVFVTIDGPAYELDSIWAGFDPAKVNPAYNFAANMVDLRKALPKLRDGTASQWERDQTLATIVELALKANNVEG